MEGTAMPKTLLYTGLSLIAALFVSLGAAPDTHTVTATAASSEAVSACAYCWDV